MRILVTGGAGFIGSHLCVSLLRQGHEVTVIDNFHSYYSRERKLEQLQRIKEEGRFTFYEEDLLNMEACREIFHRHSFDAVIHLAALPGVQYSFLAPHDYIDLDIKATVNVLILSGETGVGQVVFGSSSSVYGQREGIPLSEEMAVGKVCSPYAAAKAGAESFCHAYQQLYGFNLTILRFFTVYGPWGRPDMAISRFITQLLQGDTITVYGEGIARDFTYIDDIVSGIELALKKPEPNEVYNLGFGSPVTMDMLIEQLRRFFPHMKVQRADPRPGDVTITWADTRKAREKLGFSPAVSLQDGLERTIEWAKKYFGIESV